MEGNIHLTLTRRFPNTTVDDMWRGMLFRLMDAEILRRTPTQVVFTKTYPANPVLERVFGLSHATSEQTTTRDGRGAIETQGSNQRVAALGCTIAYNVTLRYAPHQDGGVEGGVVCEGDLSVDLSELSPTVAAMSRPVLEAFMRRRFEEERDAEVEALSAACGIVAA